MARTGTRSNPQEVESTISASAQKVFDSSSASSKEANEDPIRTHFRNYWGIIDFTDVELHLADGRVLQLHRLVLAQSDFFHRACSRDFKEAETRTIHLPDDHPTAIEILLLWLYGHTWSQCLTLISHSFTDEVALEVNFVADKYHLPKLANIASKHFVWTIPRLLKEENRTALCELLTRLFCGPEGMPVRSRALKVLHKNAEMLLSDPVSARELFLGCPEVAADLIMHAGLGRAKVKEAGSSSKSTVPAKRPAEGL